MLNLLMASLVLFQSQAEPTITDVMKATGCHNCRQVIPSGIRMSYDFALLSENGEILLHNAEDGFAFAPNDRSTAPTIAKIVFLEVKGGRSQLGTMTQFNIEDAAVNGYFEDHVARPLAIETTPVLTCVAFGGNVEKSVGWIDVNSKTPKGNVSVALPKTWISEGSEFLSGHLIDGKAVIYTNHSTKRDVTIRKIIVEKSGRKSRRFVGRLNHPKGGRYRVAGVLATSGYPVLFDERRESTAYVLKGKALMRVPPCPSDVPRIFFRVVGDVIKSPYINQHIYKADNNEWVRIAPWVIVASNSSGTRYLVTAPDQGAWVISRR